MNINRSPPPLPKEAKRRSKSRRGVKDEIKKNSKSRRRKHSHNRKQSQFDNATIIDFINYLCSHGIVDYQWNEHVSKQRVRQFAQKAEELFNACTHSKETLKLKLIKEVLNKQIVFQEDAITKLFRNGAGSDRVLRKENLTKDAMLILNEIHENDLNISSTSIEEAAYYENYNDPEFQNLLLMLKRLCKRERMLVTIYNKRISEIEEDKENAEQALVEFMHKSSVPLLNTSNLNDTSIEKNLYQSMNHFKDHKNLELTVGASYLNICRTMGYWKMKCTLLRTLTRNCWLKRISQLTN